MQYNNKQDIAYAICEEDIQNEAEYALGRTLSEEEMMIAIDALSDGIGETIDIIYRTIFTEIITQHQ